MCPCTLPMPIFIRAPFLCPYVTEHLASAHVCPSTLMVPKFARQPSSAHMCPGTIPVPICAWTPFRSPYVPGTIPVATYARVPLWCHYVPGHQSGVQMCMDTIPVPIFVLSPSGEHVPLRYPYVCLGTLLVPICIQETFCFLYVSGHLSSGHMFPDTLLLPICAWHPFSAHLSLVPCPVSS